MPLDSITPQLIEAWVAGTLSPEMSAAVDAYFDEHPDELPEAEIPDLLREVRLEEIDLVDPALIPMIEALKSLSGEMPEGREVDSWRSLLETSGDAGSLGRIHHYEVLEVIATTAMATVLKARDTELNRLVAIKVLATEIANHLVARERFVREARAMAALDHENILPVFGIHPDSHPWFAMRYVEGGSLQDALDAHDPRLRQLAFLESLARQMGAALEAAHEAGVIHRDLKPANILLSNDFEHFWLADFGIARSTADPALTYGSVVAGTPRYMSPEQAAGAGVDARTDLYALGGVLFHCATGRPPYEGDSSSVILNQVMAGRPDSVTKFNRELPGWLAQLIDALLSKDPAERPEILPALVRKKARRSSRGWQLALALLAFCAVAWAYFLKDTPIEPMPGRVVIQESGGSYEDLAEAIRAAPPDSTLLLSGDFTLDAPVETRPHHGLRLLAAPGAKPVIRVDHGGGSVITVNGSARFSGLHFVLTKPPDAGDRKVLCIRDAELAEVENCAFDVWKGERYTLAVQAEATTKTTIRRSAFRGRRLIAVMLCDRILSLTRRDGDLEMEDCLVEGSGAVFLKSRHPESRFKVQAKRVVFRGDYFITAHPSDDLRETRLEISDSLIHASQTVVSADAGDVAGFPDLLTWIGKNNRYLTGRNFLQSQGRTPWDRARFLSEFTTSSDSQSSDSPLFGQSLLQRTSLPKNLTSPALDAFTKVPAFPILPDLEATRERWEVTIEETGETFADLSEALKKAPQKATLLLTGEHTIVAVPGLITCQNLTLRSVGETKARIIIDSPGIQGLAFIGNFRAEAIVFVNGLRPDLATVLEVTRGDHVELIDCQFLQGGAEWRNWGLRAIFCKKVTLTRCLFAGRNMTAIYTSNGTLPTLPLTTQITVRDTLMDCARGVYSNPTCPWFTAQIDAERFIFRGLTTFESGISGELQSIKVSLRDSIIDVAAMFYFNRNTDATYPDLITWQGQNNLYAPFEDFLVVRLPIMSNLTYEEFLRNVPAAADEGSRVETIFQGLPVIRRSLPPDLEHPALEAFERVLQR